MCECGFFTHMRILFQNTIKTHDLNGWDAGLEIQRSTVTELWEISATVVTWCLLLNSIVRTELSYCLSTIRWIMDVVKLRVWLRGG